MLKKEEIEVMIELIKSQIHNLEKEIENVKNDSKTVELSEPIGRLARVSALQNQQFSKVLLKRLQDNLQEKKNALLRIQNNRYGICTKCGEEIPFKRLKAKPEILTCIECARELEN